MLPLYTQTQIHTGAAKRKGDQLFLIRSKAAFPTETVNHLTNTSDGLEISRQKTVGETSGRGTRQHFSFA